MANTIKALSAALIAMLIAMCTLSTPCAAEEAQQRIVVITLQDHPPMELTVAERVRQKMAMKGVVDGQEWSLPLVFDKVTLNDALLYLVEVASAEPRKIKMIIDRRGLEESGISLDSPVTTNARDVSLHQALKMVLTQEMALKIEDDETVVITSWAVVFTVLPRVTYDVKDVLQVLERDDVKQAEQLLRELIEKTVRASEPWDTLGGRATLDFAGRGVMIVAQTDEGHNDVRQLCMSLLRLAKTRQEMAEHRLATIDQELSRLQADLSRRRHELITLLTSTGRPRTALTAESLLGQAARLREMLDGIAIEIGGKQAAVLRGVAEEAAAKDAESRLAASAQRAALSMELAELEGRATAIKTQLEAMKLDELLAIAQQVARMEAGIVELELQIAAISLERRRVWADSRGYAASRVMEQAGEWLGAADNRAGDEERRLVSDNGAFAWRMFGQLSAQATQDGRHRNLLFAPHNISTVMAMVRGGARGETADEISRALHFQLSEEKLHPAFNWLNMVMRRTAEGNGQKLHIANRLWGRSEVELEQPFSMLMISQYGAGFEHLNLYADGSGDGKVINKWVSQETGGMISDLVANRVDMSTGLILTSAFYFQGLWEQSFAEDGTKDDAFSLMPGSDAAAVEVTVPMMQTTGRFRYLKTAELEIVELPYRNRVASMYVILPRANDLGCPTVEAWAAMEQQLRHDTIEELISQMKMQDVTIQLPRFSMNCGLELSSALRELGLKQAFEAGKADFSGMIQPHTGGPFFLGRIDHKARIEVDERGTKAAAATAVGVTVGNFVAPPELFVANRPFVFFIKHQVTGAILMTGRIMNPKE